MAEPIDTTPFAPPPRPRRAWPGGLVGMVVLMVAVESGLDRHGADWATPAARCFAWSHRASVERAKVADVVVLGDSVLKFGFAPLVFEGITGRVAENWATIGNPPAVALSILRAHLAAGGRPRTLIVDFKPSLLFQGVRPEAGTWAAIASVRDVLGLAWHAHDPAIIAEIALGRIVPSVRDRPEIRLRVRNVLDGTNAALFAANQALVGAWRRNWAVNHGGWLLPPDPAATTRAEFFNEPNNVRLDWTCQPGNAELIAEFLQLAADHQIPVVWVLTPIHPRLQGNRDRLGIDARFTAFVRDVRDRAPGRVTVVDGRRLGLAADRFVDATHLDRRGALAYTHALGDWFRLAGREHVADRPWVTLEFVPPILADAWGADPTAEDVAGSARFLRERRVEQVAADGDRSTPGGSSGFNR